LKENSLFFATEKENVMGLLNLLGFGQKVQPVLIGHEEYRRNIFHIFWKILGISENTIVSIYHESFKNMSVESIKEMKLTQVQRAVLLYRLLVPHVSFLLNGLDFKFDIDDINPLNIYSASKSSSKLNDFLCALIGINKRCMDSHAHLQICFGAFGIKNIIEDEEQKKVVNRFIQLYEINNRIILDMFSLYAELTIENKKEHNKLFLIYSLNYRMYYYINIDDKINEDIIIGIAIEIVDPLIMFYYNINTPRYLLWEASECMHLSNNWRIRLSLVRDKIFCHIIFAWPFN
jgi:hypothetical protein